MKSEEEKEMQLLKQYLWVAAALLGLVFMASGVFMVASALDAENDVRAGLAAEKIETTDPIALLANPDLYPDARMPKDENKDGCKKHDANS